MSNLDPQTTPDQAFPHSENIQEGSVPPLGAQPGHLENLEKASLALDLPLKASATWEPLKPLFANTHTPSFPTECLPPTLREFVEAVSEAVDIEVDFVATPALVAISLAIQGKYRYDIGSHMENSPLWCLVFGESGERKSPTLKEVMRPIDEWDAAEISRLTPAHRVELARSTMDRDRLKSLQSQASNAKKPEDREAARREAEALAAEVQDPPSLVPLVVQDVTSEAAVQRLARNHGRLAVASAEGGLFQNISGRYSDAPNVDAFNQGYSGENILTDRVTRPPDVVRDPSVAILIYVQPVVLRELKSKQHLRQIGFLPRFLFSVPKSRLGKRLQPAPEVQEQRRRRLERAASIHSSMLKEVLGEKPLAPPPPPEVLSCSTEARAAWRAFSDEIEVRLPMSGDLYDIKDWAAKLPGQVVRIAGALHVYEHGGASADCEISEENMLRAVQIGHHLVEHALAAFALIDKDEVVLLAERIVAWFSRNQLQRFTTSDCQQSLRRKTEDIGIALGRLAEHGYVRQVAEAERSGPGRKPSPKWEVRPNLLQCIENGSRGNPSLYSPNAVTAPAREPAGSGNPSVYSPKGGAGNEPELPTGAGDLAEAPDQFDPTERLDGIPEDLDPAFLESHRAFEAAFDGEEDSGQGGAS